MENGMNADFTKLFSELKNSREAHKKLCEEIISVQPINPDTFRNLFPISIRERQVRDLFPGLDYSRICNTIDNYQTIYPALIQKNNELNSQTLDLAQELATQNADHSKLFNVVKTTAKDIRDKVSSKEVGFIFKRTVAPEKMTIGEVNTYVDSVQQAISNLKTVSNPFLLDSVRRVKEMASEIQTGLQYCQCAAKFMYDGYQEKEWEAKYLRALEVETLTKISISGIEKLRVEINLNRERMETFTSIAINVMLMQLQQFVLSQTDPTELLASIDDLLKKG